MSELENYLNVDTCRIVASYLYDELIHCTQVGNFVLLKFLLKHGADINMTDISGRTALMICSTRGNEIGLITLLKYGADVNMTDISGLTALMICSMRRNKICLITLLKYRADVHMTDSSGRTALSIANRRDYIECAYMIQEYIDYYYDRLYSMVFVKKRHPGVYQYST